MAVEVVREMVARHQGRDPEGIRNALREVLQEIVLFGLYEGGFFGAAAFYGGTALRILHGLDRFSEDLDFCLRPGTESFDLGAFGRDVEEALRRFELEASFEPRQERAPGGIAAAQVRTEPLGGILSVSLVPGLEDVAARFPSNQTLRIKVEVDTGKARGFEDEEVYSLYPVAFPLRALTLPCLFSGKMHALLCRRWGNRVKGRDWYDLLWFLRKGVPLHRSYLEEKLRESGHWEEERSLGVADLRELYRRRAEVLDVMQARNDLFPFVRDPRDLDAWSASLFVSLEERLAFVGEGAP